MEIEIDLRRDFKEYKEDHMSMKEVKEMQL
jgi:hypothetical protein